MNEVLREIEFPSGQRLHFVRGDITAEHVDAIVNAANAYLQHGAGVAGAIVSRGGAVIQQESDEWVNRHGLVSHAEPAWTSGGALPCRYVIHAVGPVWGEGDEDVKLAAAVNGALAVAEHLELASIALPAISTGVFGFPMPRAARVILSAIRLFAHQYPNSCLRLIRLTLYDLAAARVFIDQWEALQDNGD